MTPLDCITLSVDDTERAEHFYRDAFDLGPRLRLRPASEPTTGFRAFTVSLLVAQPADARALLDAAVDAGAEALKPAAKSMWGYGGVVRAPDGTIWKVATSSKKDSGPATRDVDKVALLLGVQDVKASKQFYVDHGLPVAKGFGNRYVELDTASAPITLALYGHRALAKDAGVPPEGSGSHRIVIGGDIGPLTDPDGFPWETSTP